MYRNQNFSNDPHNFTNLTIEQCKGLILSKFVSIFLNLFWIKCEFKYCIMFMFPIIGEGWIPCRYIFCWTRQLWSQVLNKHCLGSIYFYRDLWTGYIYFLRSGSRERKYLWIRIFSRILIQGTKISVSVDTHIFSDPDSGNENVQRPFASKLSICGKCPLFYITLGGGSKCNFNLSVSFV